MASKPAVAVFTTSGCPHCKKAKEALSTRGVPYDEIDLSKSLELLRQVKAETKQGTVPQIFIGGEFIGGASDLLKIIDNGEFEQRLESKEGQPALPPHIAAIVKTSEEGQTQAEPQPNLQQLLERKLVEQCPSAVAPKLGVPLNSTYRWIGPSRDASEVAESLRQRILGLYDKYLAADGKAVDYPNLRSDPAFTDFCAAAAELRSADPGALGRTARIAFFVNVYNMLVVHALAVFGPPSAAQRGAFFKKACYEIGGQVFSCDDMEHGVLRGNRPSPGGLAALPGLKHLKPPTFSTGDPRARLAVELVDPRIHFALVCGAKSCPPIKVYTAASLEDGLAAAAQAFLSGELDVDKASRTVTTSKILQWYGSDFGTKEQLLRTLALYAPPAAKHALEELLAGGVEGIRIKFKAYDWGINTK